MSGLTPRSCVGAAVVDVVLDWLFGVGVTEWGKVEGTVPTGDTLVAIAAGGFGV